MMNLFQNGKKYKEYRYNKEDEFEDEVVSNSKIFFGHNSIYIDAKRKIESKSFGGSIPDGFLFDLSNKDSPEFYLVENELSKHDFLDHIFPQITKFFAFYKNQQSQSDLVEKIFSIVNTDPSLKGEFKKYLGEREIFKFIKDTIENSQNILLIIDNDKKELPEIMTTYSDTWGKMVQVMILKKFVNGDEQIYSLSPDFENIEFANAETVEGVEKNETIEYTEEFHLEGIDEKIKKAYFIIKEDLFNFNSNLRLNPQKYYISIVDKKNIAYFKFGKKKIRLSVTILKELAKQKIQYHKVKEFSERSQKFYNSPGFEILIETDEKLEEVINLLKELVSPRVIATIVATLVNAGKEGITKEEIHNVLIKTFPDRKAASMWVTVNAQVPSRITKERFKVLKTKDGRYYKG